MHVLATEAVRTAANGEAFRAAIRAATGLEVEVLSKEREGRIGAVGVAMMMTTTTESERKLLIDMGGGSCQFSLVKGADGEIEDSISLPFGAAALTRRLDGERRRRNKEDASHVIADVEGEIESTLSAAFASILNNEAPRDLYLSGGGLRGWGWLLMDQSHISPYPIPAIDGFSTTGEDYFNLAVHAETITLTAQENDRQILGVSKHRTSQMQAIACLVRALSRSIPTPRNVYFSQAGVADGYIFDTLLPHETRNQNPLIVATSHYAPRSAHAIHSILVASIQNFPYASNDKAGANIHTRPPSFNNTFLAILTNLLYLCSTHPKHSRASHVLTTTLDTVLGAVHGITHHDRALLALVSYERWSGKAHERDQVVVRGLAQLVTTQERWWARLVGQLARLVGVVYPVGIADVAFAMELVPGMGVRQRKKKKDVEVWRLLLRIPREVFGEEVQGVAEKIEKLMKKKNLREMVGAEGDGDDGRKVKYKMETDVQFT